jgi:hypothetical protein
MKMPSKLLLSKYRRDMWKKVEPNLKKMIKHLPVEEVYAMGSFSSKKRRPADIDFMVLFKTKSNQKTEKWSFDFVVAPNNKHGEFVFEDVRKWMRQKYGAKNFEIIKIK